MANQSKIYDLIIIGGSAAATAAGIYAARRKLNFKIISRDFGGEVALSGEIENYPGFKHTDGIELTQKFREHLANYNVDIEEGIEIQSVKKQNSVFCVSTSKNGGVTQAADILKTSQGGQKCDYFAKTIIIATGVRPRELNIPGEKEFRTKGVSYCTVCDGPLFSGKIVATVGGGNSALESAIMLSDIAKQVYVINKNPEFKGETVLIDKVKSAKNVKVVYNAQTMEILGEPGKFVSSLKYQDEKGKLQELKVDGVFVHIGLLPNSSLVSDVEKNQFGEIKVNMKSETNIAGLYAAGDVTDIPYKQISIAVGQGTTATLAAVEYLNKLAAK